jgi:CxxC-x17-CxxC domain-containing protein
MNRTRIRCADCGIFADVPFIPTPGRAVYCRECWKKRRDQQKLDAAQRLTQLCKSGYRAEPEAAKA